MALIDSSAYRRKKTGLEELSLFELVEKVVNETLNHRDNLRTSTVDNEIIKKEYEEKIMPLREELMRREQLYLKYHNKFIGY